MSEAHYIIDMLILLSAAVVAVPIFQRLGLGSVLGYLAAGAAVGPSGLGLIVAVEEIRNIAELGVVFLLFIMGIELKPARLWIMRHVVFGLRSAQVILTGLVFFGLAVALGVSMRSALIAGFGLALSSTAFGLQILSEKGELNTVHGRAAFGILLLQDLAVVPLIALVRLLAEKGSSMGEDVGLALLKSVLIFSVVILVGRFLLRPALGLVAGSRNSEVFAAAAVLLVLGTGWLMEQVGFSMAMGAFLAGLLLANSPYRHQIVADVQPFRGFLLGLFFMAVGMSLNFSLIASQGLILVGLVIVLLFVKTSVLWLLCRGAKYSKADSTQVAVLLSQSGEFGFVLFGLAYILDMMQEDLFQLLILMIALSMVSTPLLIEAIYRIGARLKPTDTVDAVAVPHGDGRVGHVIIAGFGRVGQRVARILTSAGLPYIALDLDHNRVIETRSRGYTVYYGDARRAGVLRAVRVADARLMVLALDNVESAKQAAIVVRELYPNLPIYARTRDYKTSQELLEIGAIHTVPETLEASLQLGVSVLRALDLPAEQVNHIEEEFRSEDYQKMGNTVTGQEHNT